MLIDTLLILLYEDMKRESTENKIKAATTRRVIGHRSKRFKQDDKPDPDII